MDEISKILFKIKTLNYQVELYYLRGELHLHYEILKEENQKIADDARKCCLIKHPGLPVRITIETTSKCNLRCRICQIKRPITGKDFPFREFKKISKEIFPILKVLHPTTIGEPFLSPYFNEMIDLLSKYSVKLDLTTNAMLLSLENIKKFLPILDDIKISIDGTNSEALEEIRIGADWRKLLKNIENLVKLRNSMDFSLKHPTITFQMTIMKSNYSQLCKMIDLAAYLGIDRVKAYHLFAFSKELNKESVMNLKEEYNKIYKNAIKRANKHKIKAFLAAPFELNNSKMFNKNIKKVPCPLLWHKFWIDINGDVLACNHPIRNIVGNVFQNSLKDIWNTPKFQELRNQENSICHNCGYRVQVSYNQPIPYDDAFLTHTGEILAAYQNKQLIKEKTFGSDWLFLWTRRTAQLPLPKDYNYFAL